MHTVQNLPDSAWELSKMESFLSMELKKFVTSWRYWTYAVIWKIGPDHRTPIWHQSYFNGFQEREAGQAQRFENTFKSCQFTNKRPGYAYLAWHRQSPFWWTRGLTAVPTDENKELFLTQSNIQTIACFPGRAPPPDGSGFCVELASTFLVPESEYYKVPIRDFIATSIAPHMCSTTSSQYPLQLQEAGPPQQPMDMAPGSSTSPSSMSLAQASESAILSTGIAGTYQGAAIHGGDASFANLVRGERVPDVNSWVTMSSSSDLFSAGSLTSNITSPLQNIGDNPTFVNMGTLSYDSILEPPFQVDEFAQPVSVPVSVPEWTSSVPSTSTTPHYGSRKGKEIDLGFDEAEALGRISSIHQNQPLLLPSTNSQTLSSLFIERLLNPPAPEQHLVSRLGPASDSSAFSAGVRGVPIGVKQPPGHSPTSLFKPNSHARFPARFRAISKRSPLIHKWATAIAPLMGNQSSRHGIGGSGSFDDPNNLALDQVAAETHKIAERKRRTRMNNKLRTLISIVPIIDKKDKVSVLSSTIEYIRQLTSQISRIENREQAPGTTSGAMGESEAMVSMSTEEERPAQPVSNTVDSAGAGPSSSSSSGDLVVVVEASTYGATWLVKVLATSRLCSLVHLLKILQDLGLEITTVESDTTNGRFHANVSVKISRNSSMSSSELRATLCRILETVESPRTSSDN